MINIFIFKLFKKCLNWFRLSFRFESCKDFHISVDEILHIFAYLKPSIIILKNTPLGISSVRTTFPIYNVKTRQEKCISHTCFMSEQLRCYLVNDDKQMTYINGYIRLLRLAYLNYCWSAFLKTPLNFNRNIILCGLATVSNASD